MKAVTKAIIAELKPGRKYILGLNTQMISKEDVYRLMDILSEMGFDDVVVASFAGSPEQGLKVIEKK